MNQLLEENTASALISKNEKLAKTQRGKKIKMDPH